MQVLASEAGSQFDKEAWSQLIDECDQDGDGKIDLDEFYKMLKDD